MVGVALISDGETAVAEQPGDRPLDHPPVPAEFLAGLDTSAGDTHADAAIADPAAQLDLVVCLVGRAAWPVCGGVGHGGT